MRKLAIAFVLAISAKALMIGGATALPSQFGSAGDAGKSAIVRIEDPITWIRGKKCPYGLATVAKRYNRKLHIWQVKCAS